MIEKVIIFIPAIEKGGVERNAIWVANELASKKIQVDVVFVRAAKGQCEKFADGVAKVQMPLKKSKLLNQRINDAIYIRKSFDKYLQTQNSDNTIVIAFQSASVAIDICRKNNVKIVCRLSNHPNAVRYEKSLLRKISEWLKPYTYKKADAVIANSKRLSMDFEEKIGKTVITVYNPIDFDRIEQLKQGEIEKELVQEAKEYEGKLLISIGRLAVQKDLETLIKGYASCKYYRESMLWIIGEGNEREKLQKIIEQLNMQEHIRLLGYQENVYKYLKYADLFIQTSLYEGCPNALIEAIAAGVPAIATNCLSGPEEVLVGGKGGDLVSIGNVEQLAERIDAFLENPNYLKEKLTVAKENLYRYSAENVSRQYMEILYKLMDKE